MNKAEHIARLRAELKALEAEVEDPIYKRAQEILDIMYPDRKTWKENEKFLPDMCEQYHEAKVYYVDENQSNKYRVIGFMYRDYYYGREEETEVEVPKFFFETDNLKEEIYKHFFNKNKKEDIEYVEHQIQYKKDNLSSLQEELNVLEKRLVEVKEMYGDE